MLKAMLWDNDGVLVDTEKFYFEACRDELAAQGIEINDDQFGLIKRADHIFTTRMVHSGFSADTAVHLGEQGGWYLNKGNPALVGGCNETGEVPHHSATQSDQCRFAITVHLQQTVVNGLGLLQ